jgi:hypothetical protein
MAKQTAVIAMSDRIYGRTIRMLWLKGRGPEKRS